ncbi:YigZ family protein [Alkaliphilus hydrothermalis]|uniref:YigZ family protein n=1 Tax=Alkaliphilus hydrothermalis TaxID=1482730 RepID=A0ABS2NKT1_9FIRM|nr:YigZ family protein [Alkaliphilus hydrothermalis]MBM7613546.1 putative YigZ family protein [Alkaliphilus hydrothermalis]
MIAEYKTIKNDGEDEIMIEKSRFIGYAMPIEKEEDALVFIKEIKTKHKDATHNVHAYVVGYNNEIQRYNDDGEPSGTAGMPVLEVIKKEDLRNVVVVVTRYYGGIKLGAGGLVRAYTKGAKIGLEAGQMVTKRKYQLLEVKVDYTLLGKLQNEILQKSFTIKDTIYEDAVNFLIYVKKEEVENFKELVVEWTNSRCQIIEGEVEYLTEINGKLML